MAIDVVSTITQQFGPDLIAKIAVALGLDKSVIGRAVGILVPGMLANLSAVAGTGAGARQLAQAAGQLAQDGALQSVGNLSAGAQAELINRGRGMFHEIVGTPAINALSLGVSKHSDISFASSKSLVAFAAPLVLGSLGKIQKSQALDASGLAKLLTDQTGSINSQLPKGVSFLPAVGVPLDATPVAAASGARRVAAASAAAETGRRSIWPVLGLLLALIAGLWLYFDGLERSRQLELAERVRQEAALVNQKAEVAAAAVKAKLEAEVKQKAEAKQKADAEAAAAKARLDAESKQKADAAAAAKARADGEAKQKADADSARAKANQEAAAAASKATTPVPAVSAALQACRNAILKEATSGPILFQVSSANILPESSATLDRVAGAAKACPTAKVGVEGHTSADGIAEKNQVLSTSRAKAIAEYLVRVGVDGARVTYIGYGQTKPIAPNDTQENKTKNRRIEFSVTE